MPQHERNPWLFDHCRPGGPCERGCVDGFAVVYDRRSRVILDVVDLINVASGH